MALPVVQFRPDVPLLTQSPLTTALDTGIGTYQNMLNARMMPQNMQQQLLAQALKNQLMKSQIPLLQAQTQLAQRKATMQPGPQWLSPAAKAQADLKTAAQVYGENSPEYKSLKGTIESEQKSHEARARYQDVLARTADWRYLTPSMRTQIVSNLMSEGIPADKAVQIAANLSKYSSLIPEGDMTVSGMGTGAAPPTTGGQPGQMLSPLAQVKNNLTPEERVLANKQYGQQQSILNKMTMTQDQQKRGVAADRFDIFADRAMNNVNQGAFKYFGPIGKINLLKDEASAAAGFIPTSLQAYRQFNKDWDTLKTEAAIMLAVPADQKSRAELNKIFNLNSYRNSPQSALQMANYILQSYRQGAIPNVKQLSEVQKSLLSRVGETPDTGSSIPPSFNTESAFNAWWKNATPEQRNAYLASQ